MIVFASFLPQMTHIEHPSLLAVHFSNENQRTGWFVPPVSMRKKCALGAFMPQTGGPRR
jgi:hypothetical protein